MKDEHPLVFIDITGVKSPLPAEQTREQPLLLDIQRHERREIGLRRRDPLTAGNGGAFKNLGDRAGESWARDGLHRQEVKTCTERQQREFRKSHHIPHV